MLGKMEDAVRNTEKSVQFFCRLIYSTHLDLLLIILWYYTSQALYTSEIWTFLEGFSKL